MSNSKISALTSATTPLAGTETVPIVQSGVTKQVTVANLTLGRAVNTAGGTFTDNHIQGTAAKGINLTANTPAAGMTSQLLNWYEEGSWTATDASGAGLTLVGGSGRYSRVGRTVFIEVSYQYPATASTSNAKIGGLPFSANTYSFINAASNSGVITTMLTDATAKTFTSYTSGTLTPNTNLQFSGKQFYVSGTYSI